MNFTVNSVRKLIKQIFECISQAHYTSTCDHIMKIVKNYMRSDQTMENVTDNFKLNFKHDRRSDELMMVIVMAKETLVGWKK